MTRVPLAAGVVPSRSPGGRPASWAATSRSGGVSMPPYASLNLAGYVGDDADAVDANRRSLAQILGAEEGRIAVMDSMHGAEIAVVDEPGTVPGVDGLVTRTPGLVIVALGADCLPLALIGTDGRTVAVAHCGWRGLAADVVGAIVRALRAEGTDVAHAVLGPAVCGTCYPVPSERAAEISARCSEDVAAAALATCADGQPGIDVRAGAVVRLQELGVAPDSIELAGGCTVEDPDLFSYRRDGVTGRQGMAVCLGPIRGKIAS